MDEFGQLARETFEGSQRYGDSGLGANAEHRAIVVYASPPAAADFDEKLVKLKDLAAFFKTRPSSRKNRNSTGSSTTTGVGQPPASLKLVTIDSRLESWSNYYPSLWVARDVFLDLVDAMDMNPAALWLLRNDYDGFHYFPSTSPATDEEYSAFDEDEWAQGNKRNGRNRKGIDTYYIGTTNFVLLWTFDHQQLHTHALWILRWRSPVEDVNAKDMPMAWFLHVLRRHCSHVRSPFLLAYTAVLSTCCNSDLDNSYRAHAVRLMERETGYHDTSAGGIVERLGMERISGFIKEIGEVLNHITDSQRHSRFLNSVLDFIVENAGVREEEEGGEEHSTRKLAAAIPSLRRRMHASQEYLGYLKERAERLSTVLFTLLTHEDAATNTDLADASRRIAEAAKRDSSSMKTVAVMTMAFLPATFFAALFSVPSLDWHATDSPIIQHNFWVYWAFTLPATAIVFGLWVLLDNRTTGGGGRVEGTTGIAEGAGNRVRGGEDKERPRTVGSKFG